MLKLKSLKISNVGRFVGDHVIDFDSRPTLIQVDAQNKNTGGSSGSGKSTIFNSFEYLLGTNHLPATVLQSRLTKNPMGVSGVFDLDGKKLTITRSKASGLSIKLDDTDIVSGNNKAAEEKLDEILGISRDLLRKMVHKRQKEGGFFLNLTPKECHAFLVEALDLKAWSKRSEKTEADIKRWSTELSTLSASLSSTSEAFASSKLSLESMEKPSIDFSPDMIGMLELTLKRAVDQEKAILLKMDKELSLVPAPEPPPAQDRSSLKPIKDEISALRAQESFERKAVIERLNTSVSDLQKKELSLAALKRQVEAGKTSAAQLEDLKLKIGEIKKGVCHTCKQTWHQGQGEIDRLASEARQKAMDIQRSQAAESEIPSLEQAIAEQKDEIQAIKEEASKSKLSDQISNLELRLSSETQKLDKELSLMNQAYQVQVENSRNQEASIRSKYDTEFASARYNVDEQTKLLAQKKAELEAYNKAVTLYDKNLSTLSTHVKTLEDTLLTVQANKDKAEKALETSTDALALIKSYTNFLFQEALDNIAAKATKILSGIPNMSTSSIYFEGFKETKSGTIKEEVSAIMTMDGEIDIPIKSMSGGERTSIDLAVDLAVIDMIEEMAGKGLDVFILDEPFDGLDSVCREQCLEILRTHVTGKKIVVVDHSNETKEMVSDRIVVVRDGQESTVCDTVI